MATFNVGVLVGSLRKESLNLKMAKALMKLAPANLALEIVPIGDLALYNEELDADPPETYKKFRETMKSKDACLFVTPEYNRSVPGSLKNAIDVGSRPYGQSVFARKPAAIVTVSPGAMGGFGANHHLRQSLVFLDMPTLAQPEAYIGGASTIFSEDGSLVERSATFMQKFMMAFGEWIERNARK